MDPLEPTLFQPIPSLIPGEVGFIFRVPGTEIGKFTMPVPNVTTYAAFEGPNKLRVHEYHWAEMVFTHNDDGGSGYHAFYFHEARTQAQVQRAVPSLSTPDNRPHRWDAVLVYLAALEDPTQPLTLEVGGEVVEVPRLFERLYKIPEMVLSTDIDVEVFVSNQPFTRAMVKTNIPVPGEVRWRDRNISGELVCLHPYLEFTEVQTGASRLTGWGTTRSRSPMGNFSRRVYRPTNHTQHQDHVISASPRRSDNGQWMLTRETVRVPEGFQMIKDLSN